MDRNQFILKDLVLGKSDIIEIGPSFAPVASKRAGWATTIVDHTDRSGLIEKYGNTPELNLDAIEEVDVIWAGGPLESVFPTEKRGSYAAIIASHVIEHIVDPIAFFKSADVMLGDDARIVLAVPDLRLCFDCSRPFSTTGQVIAAHREKRILHSWSSVFDAGMYDTRPPSNAPSWQKKLQFRPRLLNDLPSVWDSIDAYDDKNHDHYVDVHGWTFTPASFSLIMLELEALKFCNWRITNMFERDELEFIAVLERPKKPLPNGLPLSERRLSLIEQRWYELQQQANWMLGVSSESTESRAEFSGHEADLQSEIEKLKTTTKSLTMMSSPKI